MSRITRSDVYMRSEKGGDWFNEFIKSLAENKEGTTRNILDAINQKRGDTVEGVVSQYREMVGLDTISTEDKEDKMVATASTRPISIRHAEMMPHKPVVLIIEEDPDIKADLESICEHSGGNKDTHAILNFLRGELGKELVSFSDEDLLEYIEEMKKKYHESKDEPKGNAGKIGTDTEDSPEDNAADYMTHGKG